MLSEFRCAQILDAARRVFADKGFVDATMDQIAETAGVAKGTLYSYFSSKREVYLAELQRGSAELLELTRKAVAAPGDLRSRILGFVRTRLEYLDNHLEFFRIYQAEFGNMVHPAWVNNGFRAAYLQQIELLEHLLEEAVARGEARPLPTRVVATGIYELTRGLLLRRVLGEDHASPGAQAAEVTDLLWKGIQNR